MPPKDIMPWWDHHSLLPRKPDEKGLSKEQLEMLKKWAEKINMPVVTSKQKIAEDEDIDMRILIPSNFIQVTKNGFKIGISIFEKLCLRAISNPQDAPIKITIHSIKTGKRIQYRRIIKADSSLNYHPLEESPTGMDNIDLEVIF